MAGGYARRLTRLLLVAAIIALVAASFVVMGASQSTLASILLWLVVWVTVFGLLSGFLLFMVARRALRTEPAGRIPAEVGVVYAAVSLAAVWIGSVGLNALVATALVAALGWIGAFVAAVYVTRIVLAAVAYTTMITQLRGWRPGRPSPRPPGPTRTRVRRGIPGGAVRRSTRMASWAGRPARRTRLTWGAG
jgi:MFS family permease